MQNLFIIVSEFKKEKYMKIHSYYVWLVIFALSVIKICSGDKKIELVLLDDDKTVNLTTPLLFDKKTTKTKQIIEKTVEKTDLANDIENLMENWQHTENESRNFFYFCNSGSILFSTISTIVSLTNNSFTTIGYNAALRCFSGVLNIIGTTKIASNRNVRRSTILSFIDNFIKNNFSGSTTLTNNQIDEFYTQVQHEIKKIYENCPPKETLLKIALVLNSLGSTVFAGRELSHDLLTKDLLNSFLSGLNLCFCVTNTLAYTISLCRCSCEDGPSAKEKFIKNLALLLNKYKTEV